MQSICYDETISPQDPISFVRMRLDYAVIRIGIAIIEIFKFYALLKNINLAFFEDEISNTKRWNKRVLIFYSEIMRTMKARKNFNIKKR